MSPSTSSISVESGETAVSQWWDEDEMTLTVKKFITILVCPRTEDVAVQPLFVAAVRWRSSSLSALYDVSPVVQHKLPSLVHSLPQLCAVVLYHHPRLNFHRNLAMAHHGVGDEAAHREETRFFVGPSISIATQDQLSKKLANANAVADPDRAIVESTARLSLFDRSAAHPGLSNTSAPAPAPTAHAVMVAAEETLASRIRNAITSLQTANGASEDIDALWDKVDHAKRELEKVADCLKDSEETLEKASVVAEMRHLERELNRFTATLPERNTYVRTNIAKSSSSTLSTLKTGKGFRLLTDAYAGIDYRRSGNSMQEGGSNSGETDGDNGEGEPDYD
ncbi:hypothetical protein DFH06DRAFT_1144065 [Mycena polygramma]|nr:hypothetical protein DFH06DRAFT_1144065 [Mycena polygramma]